LDKKHPGYSMDKDRTYPKDVFISLQDLLRMEHFARGFSFMAKKQKVRSILGGKHASRLRGRGLDFEEVRNYVAGDDIRNIDWKVTARTQKTHSKVFSEEKEKPALIVVDQSKSMFFGSVKRTKSVVACELAALAAFRVLKQGDRVGGAIVANDKAEIVMPKRDRRNILRFLEKLVQHNRDIVHLSSSRDEKSFKMSLAKIRNIVTHDYLVIIISDFYRYDPEVVKYISRLAIHNDVILAKVYDPMERDIPKSQFIVGDGEKQISVKGEQASIRQEFEQGFDANFNQFESEMKKHKVPVFQVDTIQPVENQLKEILKTGRR